MPGGQADLLAELNCKCVEMGLLTNDLPVDIMMSLKQSKAHL